MADTRTFRKGDKFIPRNGGKVNELTVGIVDSGQSVWNNYFVHEPVRADFHALINKAILECQAEHAAFSKDVCSLISDYACQYKVGDAVKCVRWSRWNRWESATVVATSDSGKAFVHFVKEEDKENEWILVDEHINPASTSKFTPR